MRIRLGLRILFRRMMIGEPPLGGLSEFGREVDANIWICSLRCIQVIAGVLGRAGEEGQRKRLEAAKTGEVTWQPPPGLGKPLTEEEMTKEAAVSGERAVKPKVADEEEVLESIRRRQKFRSPEEDEEP